MSKNIKEPEELRKERLRLSKTTSQKVIPNKKKDQKEKYKNFLESLNNNENSSLIDYLKLGFDVCFEGAEYQTILNSLHILNRCISYLSEKGNDFQPNRLTDYLSKLSRIGNDTETEYKRSLLKLISGYSVMDVEHLLNSLNELKQILMNNIKSSG